MVRRESELLKEVKPARAANQNVRGSTSPKVSRKSAAQAAGLSDDQRKNAVALLITCSLAPHQQ